MQIRLVRTRTSYNIDLIPRDELKCICASSLFPHCARHLGKRQPKENWYRSLVNQSHARCDKQLKDVRATLLEAMAARASSSDDRFHEKAELDKPLDAWTEGNVHCFVNSNFSAEIAKKFKGKVSFVSTAVASMLFVPGNRSSILQM